MSDERLKDIQVGERFSFPESRFPLARFQRWGKDTFMQEVPPYGYVSYPERTFELYEGPVLTCSLKWRVRKIRNQWVCFNIRHPESMRWYANSWDEAMNMANDYSRRNWTGNAL